MKAFMATMTPYRLRKEGTEINIKQYRRYGHMPVERILCPSLILHGSHDADIKFYDGVYASNTFRAPAVLDRGRLALGVLDHPNSEAAQQTARRFLDRCPAGLRKRKRRNSPVRRGNIRPRRNPSALSVVN